MNSFKELEVWQKAIDLTMDIYQVTEKFPKKEQFVLCSQLNRCVISIPSNIAEGWGRGSIKDYIRFLTIAKASSMELDTQLIIAQKLGYISENMYDNLENKVKSILMMLNKLITFSIHKHNVRLHFFYAESP